MLTFNIDPFPELHTKRLHLRRMVPADAEAFMKIRSNRQLMQYIARPLAEKIEDVIKLIKDTDEGMMRNDLINWGITLQGQNEIIGSIGFYRLKPEHYRGEIGYILHSDHHRKGIMQEAIVRVIEYGFKEMKFHSIEAVTDPGNIASQNILLKNGFVKEAYFKENHFFEGKFLDSVHFGLLKNNQ